MMLLKAPPPSAGGGEPAILFQPLAKAEILSRGHPAFGPAFLDYRVYLPAPAKTLSYRSSSRRGGKIPPAATATQSRRTSPMEGWRPGNSTLVAVVEHMLHEWISPPQDGVLSTPAVPHLSAHLE
ncbi:hypothetical protein PG996_003375 [Apiospora saccharicola]|uniref:Uncharacterized protein n=1 Tax=Apiospora saccharicola TaxID=335842 RepID=A0ABR1W149_9PEZI